jgi:hypothetical protein
VIRLLMFFPQNQRARYKFSHQPSGFLLGVVPGIVLFVRCHKPWQSLCFDNSIMTS